MEQLSTILIIVGIIALVFSFWSFQLIRRHIKRSRNSGHLNAPIPDEKYFELKSRQEFIIYASIVAIGILTFIGFASLKEIKTELNNQFQTERQKLAALNKSARTDYDTLANEGKSYSDSVRDALKLVSLLKNRVLQISTKDIIKQNIYIIDPLKIGEFPLGQGKDDNFRLVKFKDLQTISGQKLPSFKTAPSIICFSTTYSELFVQNVTTESFEIRPDMYTVPSGKPDNGEHVIFSVWISQKPPPGSFSDDFGKDFK
jgi:hypothetical protein